MRWQLLLVSGVIPCFVIASCGTIGGLDDFHAVDCAGPGCLDGSAMGADGQGPDGSSTPGFATIGGTVSGLTGTGLVLQDNGGDDLGIAADGPFAFPLKIPNGGAYAVTVGGQPSSPTQTCTVDHDGSGTSTGADVTDVHVTCSTATYTVGGTVVGLNGSGLILSDNGNDQLQISTSGAFTFPTGVASGSPFSVAIVAQPGTSGPCTLSGETGVVGVANVTGVLVNCDPNTYTVGGTISGIVGTTVLQNEGANDLTVTASGSFAFPQTFPSGTNYKVTVKTQPGYPPRSQACTLTSGTGTIGSANVTGVSIACATNSFKVGGSVAGLNGTLILWKNSADTITLTADGAFTFPLPVQSGATYNVTVRTQPTGEKCTVSGGNGTVGGADINSVAVVCFCTSPTLPCTGDVDCCGSKCNAAGNCAPSCGGTGSTCGNNSACCVGTTCQGTTCQACVATNGPCAKDSQCCSGRCGLAAGACRAGPG